MAKQLITIGTPGAGGGDPAHVSFVKINDNTTELYNAAIPDTEEKRTQARVNLGLGAAATKNVGTATGNVMEVGAFGLGLTLDDSANVNNSMFYNRKGLSLTVADAASVGLGIQAGVNVLNLAGGYGISDPWWQGALHQIAVCWGQMYIRCANSSGGYGPFKRVLTELNTAIDGNGFIKAASPIVQLFSNKIELNSEAEEQDITFEKIDIGHYLIKGSSGFAQEGWYIETPKDANGNLLVAVVYEQLENGDISVKTYDYMLNNKGRIVADTETPLDIPETRWIDLRLQELPKPEIEVTDDLEQ